MAAVEECDIPDQSPYICECTDFVDSMLAKLDKRVYQVQSKKTNLYKIVDMINRELCEVHADLTFVRNDNYISIDVESEVVIKGKEHGIDCLENFFVADIVSVGDTPGAKDYIEGVDFIRHPRGIQWNIPEQFYGSYDVYSYGYGGGGYGYSSTTNQYYNPYYPCGRREPAEGEVYYVTYKFGCRDENLFNNFGSLVQLKKFDFLTFPQYREAIRSLILAFLGGPTVANIKDALSIFHPRNLIQIDEFFQQGWILNVSILYPTEDWEGDTDTSDGTILSDPVSGAFDWSITFFDSETLTTEIRNLIAKIVDQIKPAHTKVLIFYK